MSPSVTESKQKTGAMRHWARADRLARSGELRAAIDEYEQVADAVNDPRPSLRVGCAHLKMGNAEAALTAFSRALRQDAACVPALFHQALAWMDQGREEEARDAMDQVLKTQTDNYPAHCLRALIDYRAGHPERALAIWDGKWCAHIEFLTRLCVTLETDRLNAFQNERDRASLTEGAPASVSGSIGALMAQCQRAVARKDLATAHSLALRMAQDHPEEPDAHYALGYTRVALGLLVAAEKSLARSLRLQARRDLRAALGRRRPVTRDDIRAARAGLIADPFVLALRAQVLARIGRPEKARVLLDHVPIHGPESYNRFYILGLCAVADQRIDAAMRWFRYALENYGVDTLEQCLAETMQWAKKRYGKTTD